MGIEFTPEQRQVIDVHHENILVSAAAGSGKTAVLVERIIQMISDPQHPVDIDRLLIVTFTNAAAGEMRERISNAIADRLTEHPESEHLQRQSALIHNAQITTIDSFCLFLIRNHFQDIGLDPDFRVADEGEIKLLMQDVLAELLEEQFDLGDPAFLHCVECYSTGKKETVLEEAILSLYHFAMSYPWPKEWLTEHKADYRIETVDELQKAPFLQYGLQYLQNLLPGIYEQITLCKQICEEPDGPYMYAENVEHTRDQLARCLEADSWETYRCSLDAVEFDRLPAKKDDSVNAEKKEEVKNIRNAIKKQLSSLQEQFFRFTDEALVRQCGETSPAVEEILQLAILFKEKFDAAKRDKNLVDFSDMEHMALQILCTRTADGIEPTAAAKEYQAYFEEIMVDEYQDSNLVQECILQSIARADNRFMVGDVKQSIYRFRLARPELFMEKFHTYSTEHGPDRRIDLHKNFRSRAEVIDSVNAVFEQLMDESLGGITYDEQSALKQGAVYPQAQLPQEHQTELLLQEKNPDSDQSAISQEAGLIARRIGQLCRDGFVTDKKTGTLRKVRYADIVILLRSANGVDDVFREVLENYDIPCYISSKTGYFSASEISLLMQFLRVLDNPLQDIPLYGVLHSVFGGFSDAELAQIKAGRAPREKLWISLQSMAAGEPYDSATGSTIAEDAATEEQRQLLQEKCVHFMSWLSHYRECIAYMSISELLEHILEENHYLEYVAALPAGEQRRANVLMLMERAGAFEQTSFKGLYHFIRYMDQLEKYDIDYGEASTLDENANVVRIMTIHKSKGLEFPVCILAGIGRKMNRRDLSSPILTDIDLGVGTDMVDPKLRMKCKTLRKNILARKILLDNLAEELRVLYVAMTRAKEKLIITGMIDQKDKLLQTYRPLQNRKKVLLPYDLRSDAASYLDWIVAACVRREEIKTVFFTALDNQAEEQMKAATIVNDGETFINEIKTHVIKNEMQDDLQNRLSYSYPHQKLQELYAKTTVSELKLAGMEKLMEHVQEEQGQPLFETERITPYLPDFKKGEGKITGTVRGSAMHRFLELLDFTATMDTDNLQQQLEAFQKQGKLSSEYAQAVEMQKVEIFLGSELATRMKKAALCRKLHKEQPFVLGIPAKRLSEQFPEEEQVLVQGIIDVYLEEGDTLLLADYKTDVISSKQELAERYRVQLEYYAEALERITGKKVSEALLYSFHFGCGIPVTL